MTSAVSDPETILHEARRTCHEVNQPLTVILARLELVLLKMPDDDPQRAAIEQVYQESLKLSRLVSTFRQRLREYLGD
jgi:signal transduction histidine kinase